jgi:hypothetical protein
LGRSCGIPVVGIAMALAAIGTGMAVINSQPAGDMYSPADGKTQVSTKEGGLFELSKNDSLMAFPEKKGSKNQSGGGGGNIDIFSINRSNANNECYLI